MIDVEVIDHCIIIDTFMQGGVCYYSTIIGSNLTNSSAINSTINDSVIIDTIINDSSIVNSTIIVDPIIIGATIIDNVLYCGIIIFNETATFDTLNCTVPINLTDVIDYPPVAALQVSPLSAYTGATITFDGSGSYDWNAGSAFNDTLTYVFNFGDGNITSSSSPVISHAYSAAGSYAPNLTVIDLLGKSSSAAGIITPLTIQTVPAEPPAPPSGGGSIASTSSPGSNYVYKPTIEELLRGYNVVLRIRDMVRFMVLPDIYYLKVNSLSKTTMGIGYDPTFMVDWLKAGDDELYEFNGDEFKDIQLQVHSQNETEANITIRLLLKPGEDIASLISQMEQKQAEIITQERKISPTTIIVGALIVVIAALVIAVIAAYVRRKRMARRIA